MLEIDYIGGNCPVQATGKICGKPFYFRARGNRWSIGIGGEPVMAPAWGKIQPYGTEPFEAGWMSEEEARIIIERCAAEYAAEHQGGEKEGAPST
jgi:hypothetical protein